MQIGEPQRIGVAEPVENPVPVRREEPAPVEPVETPVEEPAVEEPAAV